jgi:hypothetical protein
MNQKHTPGSPILKKVFVIAFVLFSLASWSQPLCLPLHSRDYVTLERLEILRSKDPLLNFSKNKPFTIEKAVKTVYYNDSLRRTNTIPLHFSQADHYNNISILTDHSDLVNYHDSAVALNEKKAIVKSFFKSSHLFSFKKGGSYVDIDPILQFQFAKENNNNALLFLNGKGLTVRAIIAKKIGLYGYVTNNQERAAGYQQQWINHIPGLSALPGQDHFTYYNNGNNVSYWDARGGITFKIAKFIDAQFAYDKNFIGNGYRSFILSDYSSSYLFLKLNTRIWKLNYENLYARITPQSNRNVTDQDIYKYFVLHHLDINLTKWLNIGLVETMCFGRQGHIDFSYLPPVIFLKSIEQQVGSPDKANVGLDFKANAMHRFQFYGQLILNEFKLSEIKHPSRGWWGNKYAYQLGAKYINVGNVQNLDLQLEFNSIRPYTFQHYTLIPNYSNNNQSLLHPLGANFREFITIMRYQPVQKIMIEAKFIHYFQGLDSAGVNMGSNVMASYLTRPREYGFHVGTGLRATCNYASLLVSYELVHNLFIDFSAISRNYTIQHSPASKTQIFSIGARLNMTRREYDY